MCSFARSVVALRARFLARNAGNMAVVVHANWTRAMIHHVWVLMNSDPRISDSADSAINKLIHADTSWEMKMALSVLHCLVPNILNESPRGLAVPTELRANSGASACDDITGWLRCYRTCSLRLLTTAVNRNLVQLSLSLR